jgi:hypothetical protein
MVGRLKWTGVILLAMALLLGSRSLVLFDASAHIGSPIAQSCRILSATAPHDGSWHAQVPEHCGRLMSQVRRMLKTYDQAMLLTFAASFVMFAWGGALLIWARRAKSDVGSG